MSYINNNEVKDGDKLIPREDIEGREASRGNLPHYIDEHGKAKPGKITDNGIVFSDIEVQSLLNEILIELKLIKHHISALSDEEFTEED